MLVCGGLRNSASRFAEGCRPDRGECPRQSKGCVMAENTVSTAATPKAKSKPVAVAASAFEMPKFEVPKFEMPKFEMPKFEVPTAFREIAEKGIAQAKENYEKVKSAAEQATDVLEETYSTA